MARVLITGGMGFIGSNFIKYWMDKHPDDEVINVDLLTYAANRDNLASLRNSPNYRFIRGDIANKVFVHEVLSRESIDVIVHFAAESHVDRSIKDPYRFVLTNVVGTQHLLDAARTYQIRKFIQISTDEVYGSLGPEGYFTETTPLAPNSPYSASKAGSDLLARAYYETYRLPVVITRCSNNYGPYQFPEKLIPTIITRALNGEKIPIYGDGQNIRDWLFVEDHCTAIELAIQQGRPGCVYNIGGNTEHTNLDIVTRILCYLGKPTSLIQFVDDRPGHDRRYAIDASKIRMELGWKPVHDFEQGIQKTIDWYVNNQSWWRRILSGEYL